MFDLTKLMRTLENLAPLSLSQAMIDNGSHDNSGLLIKCHDNTDSVLFSLDLSLEAVKRAVRNKCDTIITHHPAIYMPVKSLSIDDTATLPIINAVKKGINVISMHLNLDIADGGIDASLCEGLGGEKYRILENVTELNGYGREFSVTPTTLGEFSQRVKKVFNTQKVTVYGSKNATVKKVASFCGGGASDAEKCVANCVTDADLIVTSDMAHHVIKVLVESGKNIIILPHYVAEEYGFKKFYQRVTEVIGNKAQTYYFDDKRFR